MLDDFDDEDIGFGLVDSKKDRAVAKKLGNMNASKIHYLPFSACKQFLPSLSDSHQCVEVYAAGQQQMKTNALHNRKLNVSLYQKDFLCMFHNCLYTEKNIWCRLTLKLLVNHEHSQSKALYVMRKFQSRKPEIVFSCKTAIICIYYHNVQKRLHTLMY